MVRLLEWLHRDQRARGGDRRLPPRLRHRRVREHRERVDLHLGHVLSCLSDELGVLALKYGTAKARERGFGQVVRGARVAVAERFPCLLRRVDCLTHVDIEVGGRLEPVDAGVERQDIAGDTHPGEH
jgi:hypothetical protein